MWPISRTGCIFIYIQQVVEDQTKADPTRDKISAVAEMSRASKASPNQARFAANVQAGDLTRLGMLISDG